MRQQPLLYLETSIFGFYCDDAARNYLRREAVRALFRQVELGTLNAVVSRLTIQELSRSAPTTRTVVLSLARTANMLDVDEHEVGRLAALYVAQAIIPAAYSADALHAAYAAVSGSEVLVTLNLKHLANEWASRRLNAANRKAGYPTVSIRTPEEVLHYEE